MANSTSSEVPDVPTAPIPPVGGLASATDGGEEKPVTTVPIRVVEQSSVLGSTRKGLDEVWVSGVVRVRRDSEDPAPDTSSI